MPFPSFKTWNLTFWSLLDFPDHVALPPLCSRSMWLTIVCQELAGRVERVYMPVSVLGDRPCLIHLSSSNVSTQVPREQLNGSSVNGVVLGEIRSPDVGQWDGPAQGRCHRKFSDVFFDSKTAEKKWSLGAFLCPATWSRQWGLRTASVASIPLRY